MRGWPSMHVKEEVGARGRHAGVRHRRTHLAGMVSAHYLKSKAVCGKGHSAPTDRLAALVKRRAVSPCEPSRSLSHDA